MQKLTTKYTKQDPPHLLPKDRLINCTKTGCLRDKHGGVLKEQEVQEDPTDRDVVNLVEDTTDGTDTEECPWEVEDSRKLVNALMVNMVDNLVDYEEKKKTMMVIYKKKEENLRMEVVDEKAEERAERKRNERKVEAEKKRGRS